MKIYPISEIEQGSEAWFNVRKLKLTASEAQSIANNGKGLESLVIELMADYLSTATKERYSNDNMARGNDLEPVAREMYSLEKGVQVEQVGFIEASKYVGCSPDGLVSDDGLLEIKCPDDVGHYKIIAGGLDKVDSKYLWQVQMQLLITKRAWCDLVIYSPNFFKSLLVFRIEPDKEKQEALKVGIEKGVELIKEHLKKNQK